MEINWRLTRVFGQKLISSGIQNDAVQVRLVLSRKYQPVIFYTNMYLSTQGRVAV